HYLFPFVGNSHANGLPMVNPQTHFGSHRVPLCLLAPPNQSDCRPIPPAIPVTVPGRPSSTCISTVPAGGNWDRRVRTRRPLEPRQRMPLDYFCELVAQIPEIVANGFRIHGIVKELDDPRTLALVEPYTFARLTYDHNDIRVSIVDGGQGRAVRRACAPRRGG